MRPMTLAGCQTLTLAAEPRPRHAEGAPRWLLRAACPPQWSEHLERCGGGFFHAPPGLAGMPPGHPLFAELVMDKAVIGVAAGMRSGCALSLRPRHVYFPTVPALHRLERREEAFIALMAALRAEGVADVVIDSFDAGWLPALPTGKAEARSRVEYVVRLVPDAEALARRCSAHHRLHLKRGACEGWTLRILDGEEARELLGAVQRGAAARAADRGDPFAAGVLPPEGAHWGATTFSAWHDRIPLAAALIGWANRRAFFVLGGSTPEGYARGAAVWLHWRIMSYLADKGFTAYNLGGTTCSAALSGDPAHGLYRFMTAFGADVVPRRSIRWTLRPSHVRAHRLARWVATGLHSLSTRG
jgi:GNAT acetyltransferase-like protein